MDELTMPTKREKSFVQFFYVVGDDPFICGVDGHFTPETLNEISTEFLEENDDAFSKGSGDYLFQVNYENEQRGEYGVVEISGWWNLTEVLFEPLT